MNLIKKYEKKKLRYETQLSQMSDDSNYQNTEFGIKGICMGKLQCAIIL